MAARVVMNNGDSLGYLLQSNLKNADRFLTATAYLSLGGLGWVMDSLNQILDRQGQVSVLHGFYPRITETEAIKKLAAMAMDFPLSMSYHVYMPPILNTEGTFHAKMYLASEGEQWRNVIGSSNLTHGGLSSNLEANCILTGDSSDREIQECRSIFEKIHSYEHLHQPDGEWISAYDELRQLEQRTEREIEPKKAEIYTRLIEKAQQEPWLIQCQDDCVVLALRALSRRRPVGAYFHLREITSESSRWAVGKYSETNWRHSVRRVLNMNTIHKYSKSKQLFEREDGAGGTSGRYRLSTKGWFYFRNMQKSQGGSD